MSGADWSGRQDSIFCQTFGVSQVRTTLALNANDKTSIMITDSGTNQSILGLNLLVLKETTRTMSVEGWVPGLTKHYCLEKLFFDKSTRASLLEKDTC